VVVITLVITMYPWFENQRRTMGGTLIFDGYRALYTSHTHSQPIFLKMVISPREYKKGLENIFF